MWTLECVPFGAGLKSKGLSEDFAVVLLIKNSGNFLYKINKGPLKDWQNLFAIQRFCYIEVLFHILYYYYYIEVTLKKKSHFLTF